MSDFDKWNELKKNLNDKEENIKFRPRDIFFMHIGQNIGHEQNEKGEEFLRPVIVYKKLSNKDFLGIPLPSKEKHGSYFFNFSHKNRKQTALFNQIKVFDIKRKKLYFGTTSENTFKNFENNFVEFVKATSQKGKDDPLGQNKKSIISNSNQKVKSILFDIVTPKWVLFFKPIIEKLKQNHKVIITTRGDKDYNETTELLKLYNLDYISLGGYGGADLEGKLKSSLFRMEKLIEIVKNVDVVVSGSVVDINRVAFGLGKKIVNFEDIPIRGYNNSCESVTPNTRLTAPFSTILLKPFMIPNEIFKNLGVCDIREYNFIDPLIWLKNFTPDLEYVKKEIPEIDLKKYIVVVREEEFKASYVQEQTLFLYEAVKELQNLDINLIIIPRYESKHLKEEFKKAIILEKKIIIQHLLAYSNLFIGGGGTINTEATYFGVPVISTRSFISHYDKFLMDNNLMWHSNEAEEIIELAKDLMDKKTNAKEVYNKMNVDIDMFIESIIE